MRMEIISDSSSIVPAVGESPVSPVSVDAHKDVAISPELPNQISLRRSTRIKQPTKFLGIND